MYYEINKIMKYLSKKGFIVKTKIHSTDCGDQCIGDGRIIMVGESRYFRLHEFFRILCERSPPLIMKIDMPSGFGNESIRAIVDLMYKELQKDIPNICFDIMDE